MRRRERLIAASAAIFLAIAINLLEAHPALASQGNDGCATGRTAVEGTSYFDGWTTDMGQELGGVTVQANTYSPYIYPTATNSTAWSMLGNPANFWDLAQVGYLENAGNTGGSTGPGSQRTFFAEIGDSSRGVNDPFEVWPSQSTLPTTPWLDQQYIYNTLFGSGQFTFQIGAPGVAAANVNVDPNGHALPPYSPASGYWPGGPLMASSSVETHNSASQLPGDVNNPVYLANAGFVDYGLSTWQTMYQTPPPLPASPYTVEYVENPDHTLNWGGAFNQISSNELAVWDIGCPTSLTTSVNTMYGNQVLDSQLGTQAIEAKSGSYGPYYFQANAPVQQPGGGYLAGGYVVYNGAGYAMWSPQTGQLPDYMILQSDGNVHQYGGDHSGLWNTTGGTGTGGHMAMQSDGNLVLFNGSGGAVWQTSDTWASTNSALYYGPAPAGYNSGCSLSNCLFPGGTAIKSPSNTYNLYLTTNCDLQLRLSSNNGVVWHTNTSSSNCGNLEMDWDGNLVLFDKTSHPVWQTSSVGYQNAHMIVNDNGHLTVQALWQIGSTNPPYVWTSV